MSDLRERVEKALGYVRFHAVLSNDPSDQIHATERTLVEVLARLDAAAPSAMAATTGDTNGLSDGHIDQSVCAGEPSQEEAALQAIEGDNYEAWSKENLILTLKAVKRGRDRLRAMLAAAPQAAPVEETAPYGWIVERDSEIDGPEFFLTEKQARENASLGMADTHVFPVYERHHMKREQS